MKFGLGLFSIRGYPIDMLIKNHPAFLPPLTVYLLYSTLKLLIIVLSLPFTIYILLVLSVIWS